MMRIPRNSIEWLLPSCGRKVMFVHIPKTGGKFIQHAFGRRIKRCPTMRLPELKGHKTYQEYKTVLAGKGISLNDVLTFAVVRNPWAWHVSWFHYIRQDRGGKHSGHFIEHELFRVWNFKDYLHWLKDPYAIQSPQGYLRRQLSDWVIGESGEIEVDEILFLENLDNDFSNFLARHGFRLKYSAAKVNASAHMDYRYYYDDEGVEVVDSLHKDDIKLFGFTF